MNALPEATRHAIVTLGFGEVTLVRNAHGISGLYFPQHWTRPDPALFGPAVDITRDDGFDQVMTELEEYWAGHRTHFDVPLHLNGSPRARHVWELLCAIPYGQTTTYGALAQQLGTGTHPRAVGRYVGHNPCSLLVPCHRVVGASGDLTGYAGGLPLKRKLLEREGAIPPQGPTLW